MELNKILERDLKLACLIPTHWTEKASCSYCTISAWAFNNTGHAQGTGLAIRAPYPSSVGFTHFLSFCPWTQRWVEGVGGKKERKEKKGRLQPSCDFLGWYSGITSSIIHRGRVCLALSSSLRNACFPHSCPFDNRFRMNCCMSATYTRTYL